MKKIRKIKSNLIARILQSIEAREGQAQAYRVMMELEKKKLI